MKAIGYIFFLLAILPVTPIAAAIVYGVFK
jgi:hypothetical protein